MHIGLGAFHRSHQLWYTAQAADAADWGVAAFTVRSPAAALPLAEQDGLYTLIERDAGGDRATVIGNLVAAYDGADMDSLRRLLCRDEVAIVTMTVTEAGYAVADDATRLRAGADAGTPIGRLINGLRARREAGGGPLAVVSCDNLPRNGRQVAAGLASLAAAVDPDMTEWIRERVSFVSTAVDRITPRATPADAGIAAALTGFDDHAPVVAEPFAEWILAGEFPAGRPDWESAGAKVVPSVEPYSQRKLWLLNGAHTLLAARGLRRGLGTVADAIADPRIADELTEFWDAALTHLPDHLQGGEYVSRLRRRFRNPRIEHRLAQIQQGAATKFALRMQPIVDAERENGRDLSVAARVLEDIRALDAGAARPRKKE